MTEGEKVLAKTIARYGRVVLLIVDELGDMELDRRGAELALPGPDRMRREELGRDRLQPVLVRVDQHLHRPEIVRRNHRPAHLQEHHHRKRHHSYRLAHSRTQVAAN